MIYFGCVEGCTRHLGMGVPGLCLSGGKYFSIFNPGGIVTIGSRVVGDGISGLLSPF